jgi:hypothetical protein
VTGSFVLGLFLAATTERLLIDPRWRLLLAVGFLGAYTTFSTYTHESVQLLLTGNWWSGLANLLSSTLLGLLASAMGIALGRHAERDAAERRLRCEPKAGRPVRRYGHAGGGRLRGACPHSR